jgi:sugar phosphate isomerase/epimerase
MENMQLKALVPHQKHDLLSFGDERAIRAARVLLNTCAEKGVKVCSWREFDAWEAYMEGRIDEPQLAREAAKELQGHAENYGKTIVIERENPHAGGSDIDMKKRAKRASRIFRNVCRNTGMNLCFFHSFSAWSDFITGKIDELEFLGRIAAEISKMTAQDQP